MDTLDETRNAARLSADFWEEARAEAGRCPLLKHFQLEFTDQAAPFMGTGEEEWMVFGEFIILEGNDPEVIASYLLARFLDRVRFEAAAALTALDYRMRVKLAPPDGFSLKTILFNDTYLPEEGKAREFISGGRAEALVDSSGHAGTYYIAAVPHYHLLCERQLSEGGWVMQTTHSGRCVLSA